MEVEKRTISVEEFARKLKLEILYEGTGEMTLTTVNVSRPGLQLAGFFDYFGENRVQVMGNAEMKYYNAKPENDKVMIMDLILERKVPCTIVSRSLEVPKTLLDSYKKHSCPLFLSPLETTQLVNNLTIFLNEFLAPTTRVHGVFVDVSGVGVLITGKSGIGKSETALELIKRGHRLVADDSIIVKNVQNNLYGESPEVIRYFMELRGIGIIDTRNMYGVTAIKDKKHIDFVIEMQNWDDSKEYDRLGGDSETENILGVEVPKMIIPIVPGRNLPVIIEAAAANFLLKKSGYNAAEVLVSRSKKVGAE